MNVPAGGVDQSPGSSEDSAMLQSARIRILADEQQNSGYIKRSPGTVVTNPSLSVTGVIYINRF